MSLVSFVKADLSDSYQLKQAITDSLNLIHYHFPNNLRNIIIKPNMCYYWDHSTGQTTNPKFVAAVIKVLRENTSPDVKMSIVESDASAMKCKYAFRFLGYERIARNHDVSLVNLSCDKSETVEVKAGKTTFRFRVPNTIKNADLKINVPKIKYLTHTKISCALKNVFGCNPEPNKFRYHSKLDEAIVALNKIMKFDISIVDGIIVSGSRPVRLDLIASSVDPVALDTAAAKIAGVDPRSIRHIKLAHEECLGNTSFISIGTDPKFFQKRYPQIGLNHKILHSAYRFITWSGLLDTDML